MGTTSDPGQFFWGVILINGDKAWNGDNLKVGTICCSSIPEVNFEDLVGNNNQFNVEAAEKIKKFGVVVVRNVIEKEETKDLLDDVEKYMKENGQDPKTTG